LPAPNIRKTFALPRPDEDTIIGSSTSTRAGTVDRDPNSPRRKDPSGSKAAARKLLSRSQADDEPDFTLQFLGGEEDEDDERDDVEDEDEGEDEDEDGDDEDDEDDAGPVSKKKLAPNLKSKLKVVDQFKDWDNGETLTPAQRTYVMALGSNYERAQMMNKLRNTRMLREMEVDSEVSDLFEELKTSTKPKSKGKKKATEAHKTRR
jgi:hypothetical protein